MIPESTSKMNASPHPTWPHLMPFLPKPSHPSPGTLHVRAAHLLNPDTSTACTEAGRGRPSEHCCRHLNNFRQLWGTKLTH